MKKLFYLLIFTLIFFSCNSDQTGNFSSDVNIYGDKISIVDPSKGVDSASGKISPKIDYKLDNKISITYPENSPTILLFVAHWCPHCQEELPEVIKWIETEDIITKGVKIVLIVTGIDSTKQNYPPDEWLFNEQWKYPVIYDDNQNSIAEHFGVKYFPSWVFTENDGLIAFTHAGRIGIEELTQLIN